MYEKVRQALEGVLKKFESGNIPEAIAYSTFPIYDIPSARWSLLNRILMFIAGTQDARGYRQWEEVGRYVKKGAKSFSILAPRLVRKVVKNGNGNGSEEPIVEVRGEEEGRVQPENEEKVITVLAGFLAVPVFRVEDTEGEPLAYEKIKVPEFPLLEVARDWGISVKGIPWGRLYYGYFDQVRNEISLASDEETVFFHELSHVAHQKVLGQRLKGGQDWKQEIVAELSAAVLCHLFGKTPSKCLGNNYQYISRYAEEAGLTPIQGCYRVIKDVEDVLNLIFKQAEEKGKRQSNSENN